MCRSNAFLCLSASLLAAVLSVGCPGKGPDRAAAVKRLDIATEFLSKGQLDPAETEARKALGFDNQWEEVHLILGLVDFLRAVNNFRLVEIDDCLTGIDAEGLRDEMDKLLLGADKHFATAFELDNTYGEALSNRGSVASKLENYRDAVRYFKEALELPGRLQNASLTRANLGWAYFELGDHVAAAKELRQARQFQPGMCLTNYRLGRVYFAREEWEKALEKFKEVVSDATCPLQEAHYYASLTLTQLGMTDSLQTTTDSCVAMAPKSCIAAKCRALVVDDQAAGNSAQ